MKKLFASIGFVFIAIVTWLAVSGRLPSSVSSDNHRNISIDGENRIVVPFQLQPAWVFTTHQSDPPTKIERWRKLILLGQSDVLAFLDNKESRKIYGRIVLTDELIEKQRNYVIDRFKDNSFPLKISRVYLVLDRVAKVCHLLVPVDGPQGQYYMTLEWIDGDWYLVPGTDTGDISWALMNGEKILRSVESHQVGYEPAENLDRAMRKLSAAYLRP